MREHTVVQDVPAINEIMQRLADGAALLEVERWFFAYILEHARRIFEMALQLFFAQPDVATDLREHTRESWPKMRSKERRDVVLRTLFGTILVTVSYWVRDLRGRRGQRRRKRRESGTGVYPELWAMGVRERCTPAMQAEVVRALAMCASCREASELLASRGIHLSHKQVRQIGYATAKRAVEQRDRELATGALTPIFAGRRVVVAPDGGRYRARINHTRGRNTAKGRRGFNTPWKEPKGFVVYVLDDEGKPDKSVAPLCDFVCGDAARMMQLLTAYLLAHGIGDAAQLIVVADGAHWIWSRIAEMQVDLRRAGQDVDLVEVLDFYHAVEHLSALSELMGRWSRGQRQHWVRHQRRRLLRGKHAEVIAAIDTLRVSRRKHRLWRREREYFAGENADRMRYDEFRENGFPIGSGAIESATRRVINQRVKSNASFWKPENAELIIHARAQLKFGRFEEMIQRATSTYEVAA